MTKLVSQWFPYRKNEENIESLSGHAGILGSISVFGDVPSPEFFAFCRERGIETYRLVGGEGTAFDTPEHARATTAEYLRQCEETGYGGIDLDFEHFGGECRDSYAEFMRQSAAALHQAGKRLSICVAGFPRSQYPQPPAEHFYDPKVIGDECDEVRVMGYDMCFAPHGWVGATSTWPWAREVMQFWLEYVPREKLIMGLPAYGNDFDTRPGSGNGKQTDYDSPEAVPGAHNVEVMWLRYERIHAYRYLDAADHPRILYASDRDSTAAHLETVDELDVRGISFWHYGSMTPGIWQAVYDWPGRK